MRRILFAVLLAASMAETRAASGPLSPFFSNSSVTSVVITATTVDAANSLYIAGRVDPTVAQPPVSGIPTTPNAYLPNLPACPGPCSLNFVAKISSSGALMFSTYLDADATTEHLVSSLAVDSSGNVFVAGAFASSAVNILFGSGFIEKLSPDGSKLLASYQIASGAPAAIAIAPSGDVFLTGQARANGQFVTTPGAFQATGSGTTDAFVIRMDAALSKPIYATLVGSADYDAALAIVVDAAGEAYITGWTLGSPTFPITTGATRTGDASFVVKLRADGSAPVFSTLYNFAQSGPTSTGFNFSVATTIAVDGSGVYIAGAKTDDDLDNTQFAAKLTPDGSSLIYQTSFPGSAVGIFGLPASPMQGINFSLFPQLGNLPSLSRIAPDSNGNLLIMGQTDTTLKLTPDAFFPCSPVLVRSRILIELDPAGAVNYESYLPGGLAIRGDGEAWYSDSSGAVQRVNIHDPLPRAVRCVADAFTGLSGPIAPGKLVILTGPGIGPDVPATEQIDATGKVAVGLNGVNVYFNGIAAPLLSASANMIEAVVPFENLDPMEFPTSTVAILKNGVEIDGAPVPVVASAPAVLIDPQGCISGFNSDGTLNSSSNPAAPGTFVAIFGEGAGLMSPAVTGGIGNGQSRIVTPIQVGFGGLNIGGAPPLGSPLTILYAGDVPGFVEGLFELNVQLPASRFATGKNQINLMIANSVLSTCAWMKNSN